MESRQSTPKVQFNDGPVQIYTITAGLKLSARPKLTLPRLFHAILHLYLFHSSRNRCISFSTNYYYFRQFVQNGFHPTNVVHKRNPKIMIGKLFWIISVCVQVYDDLTYTGKNYSYVTATRLRNKNANSNNSPQKFSITVR